jgi:hypothetical protein
MKWPIFLLLAPTLAACGIERPDIIRNTGLGDRCADYLRLSYPGAKIQVTLHHTDVATTESGKLGLMIVDVEGVRPDIPATGGFLADAVAARCRFENGILTQFRWTKGPYR